MGENKTTAYENNTDTNTNKIEWIEKEPIPRFRYGGREYRMLNQMIEVEIGGVLYRVKSVYNEDAFMGDVLDSLTMEKINRIIA